MFLFFTIIIGFIFVYSFILNLFFGHRQFWKISSITTIDFVSFHTSFRKFIDFLILKSSEDHFLSSCQAVNKSLVNIISLPEDVTLQYLSFLDSYSLSMLSCVSKNSHLVAQNDSLWIELRKNLLKTVLYKVPSEIFDEIIHFNAKNYYFYTTFRLPFLIAKIFGPGCICTILNGNLYDLTNFADEHPGGRDVMQQWNGRDSTKIFNLANHSTFALQLRSELLIWSPFPTLGKKGFPKSMKKTYEKASMLNNIFD